jgi:hypothetical protein
MLRVTSLTTFTFIPRDSASIWSVFSSERITLGTYVVATQLDGNWFSTSMLSESTNTIDEVDRTRGTNDIRKHCADMRVECAAWIGQGEHLRGIDL